MPKERTPRRPCALDFCDRTSTHGALCEGHYRQRKRGASFAPIRVRPDVNEIDRDGDVSMIFVDSKGARVVILVDTADLPLVRDYRWCLNANGYASTHRLHATMHRVLMGDPPGMQVDHINGNIRDNRRSNLRIVSKDDNAANRQHSWSRTGCIGIGIDSNSKSKPYVVAIRGKHRGQFATLAEARAVRDRVRAQEGMPPALNDKPCELAT